MIWGMGDTHLVTSCTGCQVSAMGGSRDTWWLDYFISTGRRKTVSTWSSPVCKSWWIHWMSECLVKCQITSEDSWNKILEWRPVRAQWWRRQQQTHELLLWGGDVWCHQGEDGCQGDAEAIRCLHQRAQGGASRQRDNHRAICVR